MSRPQTQRTRRVPHIALADLRAVLGLTIDQVRERMAQELPPGVRPPTRASVSAIENGHRGVSQQMLDAFTAAYGLRPGAIVTDYEPQARQMRSERVAS